MYRCLVPRKSLLQFQVLLNKMFKKKPSRAGFQRFQTDLESGEREWQSPDEMRGLWKKAWVAIGAVFLLVTVAGFTLPESTMGSEMGSKKAELIFVAITNRHGEDWGNDLTGCCV